MSGQRSLRGRGERAGPGASLRPLLRRSRRGPRVLPCAATQDIAVAGSGGGSCRGRRVFPPAPLPAGLGSPARPSSSTPLPLRSAPPRAPPTPPSPQAQWCGPPPADRPGIPARSPGLAPARAPAPSPSPRPEPPTVAAAASFERGPGPAAATAAAAELRRLRRRAPWETPGASAAKRLACRPAVPAASGGPARL